MKAHEVKYGTKVKLVGDDITTPIGALSLNKNDEITIHKLDGMYCNGTNKDGKIVYVSAWTEVEEL